MHNNYILGSCIRAHGKMTHVAQWFAITVFLRVLRHHHVRDSWIEQYRASIGTDERKFDKIRHQHVCALCPLEGLLEKHEVLQEGDSRRGSKNV